MRCGVAVDLSGLGQGERVCIRALGNPLPFAVGESALSEESIQLRGISTLAEDRANIQISSIVQGLQGKVVDVLHCYGDSLTLSGPSSILVPNTGFTRAEIRRLQDFVEAVEVACAANVTSVPAENCSGVKAIEIPVDEASEHVENESEDRGVSDNPPAALDDVDDDVAIDIEDNSEEAVNIQEEDHNESGLEGDGNEQLEQENDGALISEAVVDSAQMDEAIVRYVCLVLRYVVKDTSLPVLVSTIWPIVLRYVQLAESDESVHGVMHECNVFCSGSQPAVTYP
jgi:hypothetical protein